jgi:predicted dithiol-disulfide oxidoreductase (DUF899 family)
MKANAIVSPAEWTRARKELMAKEKELTHAREAVAAARRALPWEPVEKRYVFQGPKGEESLEDLFAGRSQLVVYHFMFAPEWEAGCKSCSFWADNFERSIVHLAHRDVTMIAVSRAPLAKLEAYKKRLGWTFKWVSSGNGDFNYDYCVSFDSSRGEATYNYAPKTYGGTDLPGLSVFARAAGGVFHTYSTFSRGIDNLNATYQLLDLVPKGRDEDGFKSTMEWLRRNDEYSDG